MNIKIQIPDLIVMNSNGSSNTDDYTLFDESSSFPVKVVITGQLSYDLSGIPVTVSDGDGGMVEIDLSSIDLRAVVNLGFTQNIEVVTQSFSDFEQGVLYFIVSGTAPDFTLEGIHYEA